MRGLPSDPDDPRDPHPRLPGWVGDLLAAVIVVGALFPPYPEELFRPAGPWAIAFAVAPALILPLRRRWPIPVLVACLAFFGLASFSGMLSPGAGIAVAVAMFAVTTRMSRRTGFSVAGIAIAAIVGLSIPASLGSVFDPRVFQFALVVAFAAAAGDGARSRREYIAAITERAERAERTREAEARRRVTEERLRIARDLHDAVAHQIAVISLNAGVASSAIDTTEGKAQQALATIRGAARTVLAEIGDLLGMLRAEEGANAETAPQPGLVHLEDLAQQFTLAGLEVHTRVEGDLDRVGGAVGLVAYRVVQEALTNAHKHGTENRAHVLAEVGTDAVTLVVTNPMATKLQPAQAPPIAVASTGLGLIGLRERVASVRGTVEAGPAPGGWRVAATLPLAREGSP